MAEPSTGTPTDGAGEPRPRSGLPEAEPTEQSGDATAIDGQARPPRPLMERTPAPASPALVRPAVVDVAIGLHYGGLGAGAVGVASALLWRTGSRDNLLAMMAQSTVDEARKQQLADVLLYGAVGMVVVLLFVQLAMVVRLAAGRLGARPALVVVVLAQLLLYFFASDIVRGTGWKGLVVEVGLGLQAVTAVVASLLSWLPPVGRWLGRRPVAGRR